MVSPEVQTYYSNYLQDFPTKVNSACHSKLNSLFFLQNLFLVLFVFSLFVEWPHHKVILVSFLLALRPPTTTPNQSQNPTCLFPNHLSEGSPPLRHSTSLFSTRTIARALQLVSPTPRRSDELTTTQPHQNALLLSASKCPLTLPRHRLDVLIKHIVPFFSPLVTVLPNTSFQSSWNSPQRSHRRSVLCPCTRNLNSY